MRLGFFRAPSKGLASMAAVLLAGSLAACNKPDTNYIDYKNFADDHSIDYHKVLEEQIQEDNQKNQKEERRKLRRYLKNYHVE